MRAPECVVWLYLVLVAALVSSEYPTRFNVLSGGSNRHESLVNTALLVKGHREHLGAQVVFPNLNFTCSGVIHKLFFLGRGNGGPEAPTLSVWKNGSSFWTPQLSYSVPLLSLREVLHSYKNDIALYEHTIERQFDYGDMLGFYQPNASLSSVVLQYQENSGETIVINNPPDDALPFWPSLNNPGSMLPLVAIESSKPECSTTFLSKGVLERVVNNYLAIVGGSLDKSHLELKRDQQRLFPDLKFTCSDTISSVIVGADIVMGGLSAVPEVQVWRREAGNDDTYSRVSSASLSAVSIQEVPLSPGVYRLETSLSFERGDILGIFYPARSNVLLASLRGYGSLVLSSDALSPQSSPESFQWNGSTENTTIQWPLVTFESGDSDCIEGFMPLELLTLLMQRGQIIHIKTTLGFTNYVVPELSFTTSGLLQKYIFVSREDSNPRPQLPHFRVWREGTDQGFIAVDGTYTFGRQPVRSQDLNVYEYTLDPPVPVEVGDFIGWEQHLTSTTRLLPLLLNNTGYTIHRASALTGNEIRGTTVLSYKANPLIGVQILVSVTNTAPTTTSPTLSSTPDDKKDDKKDDGIQQILGTILASGLMGLIILLVMSLMLIFVLWAIQRHRKKREKAAAVEIDLDNPLYAHEPPGHQYQELQKVATKAPEVTPMVQKEESVEYDEPIVATRRLPAPPVAPKPIRSPTSPPPSPKYHTIEPQDITSPLFSPQDSSIGSPQFHTAPITFQPPLFPSLTSSLDRRFQQSSPSLSPFASLNRKRPIHSREHSNTSEHNLTKPPSSSAEYATIEPPRWDSTGNKLRSISMASSTHTGYHSRTSSQGTNIWDEEPTNHMYHQLTSQEGYSRLYQGGMYVPTQLQRQRAATTAHTQKINIYAALSECSEPPNEADVEFFEESDTYWRPARDSSGLYDQLARRKYREIMRSQIKVQHVLGSGNFGEVNKGKWQCEQGSVEVAVKTLKAGSSEEDTVRFLQEAAIMGQFRHPNIVELLGVVTLKEPVIIVLELLSLGDLKNHLLSLRPLTPGDAIPDDIPAKLLSFCRDIASGMEHLQRKAFVHRDLAARNILVAEDNTCKIGDFGMARDLENENYYISRGGKIPIRWSPPEALNFKKYTTASDVWSFAVVMYEIWSLGHKPYEGYTNRQTQSLVERGERLAPPPGCPRPIYSLMIHSWHPQHSSRPTFLSLLKTLSAVSADTLSWREEEEGGGGGDQAAVLGAPLEAGRNLYPELQHAYTHI